MLKKAFQWLNDKPAMKTSPVLLKGTKVVLRDKHISDAAKDYEWRTDRELSKLDATEPITMPYEIFLRLSRDEITYLNPYSKRLAIDTYDGHHIGNCMYYDIDCNKSEVELGIMIDRQYWNQGYGTDAIETLLAYIFTTTTLKRAYLHTLDWNQRGRSSFTKAGLQEIKTVSRHGKDFIMMEILKKDWESRKTTNSRAGDLYKSDHK